MRRQPKLGYFRRDEAPRSVHLVRTGFKNVVRPRNQKDEQRDKDLGRALAHGGSVLCLTSAARYHNFSNQEADCTFLAMPHANVYGVDKFGGLRLISAYLEKLRKLGAVQKYPMGDGDTMLEMTTPAFTMAHLLAKSGFAGASSRCFIDKGEAIDSLKLYAMRYPLVEARNAALALGLKDNIVNMFEAALAMHSAA